MEGKNAVRDSDIGLSPDFHIHVSVSDLYIPRIGPHISSSRNGSSIVGIYSIIRSQTHECGNWDWGPDIPFLGIFVSNFRHFVFAVWGQSILSEWPPSWNSRVVLYFTYFVVCFQGQKMTDLLNIKNKTFQKQFMVWKLRVK